MVMRKIPRPFITRGPTVRKKTNCGSLYITLNRDNTHGTFEVFAHLGKQGSCQAASNEALTRMISLSLRYSVPVEEIITQLRGIKCPHGISFPKEEATASCPDAIARVLEEYYDSGPKEAS